MANALAISLINGYRCHVSPRKGFRCAYHVVYAKGSCSDIALRLAQRVNGVRLVRLMLLQAKRCRLAFMLSESHDPEREWLKHEPRNEKLANRWCVEGAGCGASCFPWS